MVALGYPTGSSPFLLPFFFLSSFLIKQNKLRYSPNPQSIVGLCIFIWHVVVCLQCIQVVLNDHVIQNLTLTKLLQHIMMEIGS